MRRHIAAARPSHSADSEVYDRTNTLSFVHQVERGVDIFERHRMSDELVYLDVAVHVLLDHAG